MGVGMPQTLLLCQFGEYLHHAFGHVAYHVGSSLTSKEWRDVDVRLMIPDDEYESRGFGSVAGYPQNCHTNKRWVATVLAYTQFGRHLTGLPIDFQIQPVSWANEKEKGSRGALFDVAQAQASSELWDMAQKAMETK